MRYYYYLNVIAHYIPYLADQTKALRCKWLTQGHMMMRGRTGTRLLSLSLTYLILQFLEWEFAR